MEAFGLLHFLQNLLQNTADTADETTTNKPPSPPAQPPSQPTDCVEHTQQNPAQDAYLQFIQAHDARSGRLRNKK